MEKAEKRSSGFIIPGSNTSIPLKEVKEPLYFVAILIEISIILSLLDSIGFGRDYDLNTLTGKFLHNSIVV